MIKLQAAAFGSVDLLDQEETTAALGTHCPLSAFIGGLLSFEHYWGIAGGSGDFEMRCQFLPRVGGV
jgi:hypothetical protein